MTQLEQDFKRMYPMAPDAYKRWQKIQELPRKIERQQAFIQHFGKSPETYQRWVKKDQVEVGK